MPTLESWQPFLTTVASAAATLTGLVFVAVSINLKNILEVEGRTALAAESLLQLLGPMFLALAALAPGQALRTLGVEVLLFNGILWFAQTQLHVTHIRRRSGQPFNWVAKRILRTHVAAIPIFVAAALLLHGNTSTAMLFLAAGLLLSFYAGIVNAWIILIEILR